MSIPAAYCAVILIWSTTPLAIKWSVDGGGVLFSVMARMSIGLVIVVVVLRLFGKVFDWSPPARQGYLVAGLGIYISMVTVYWGAQWIPSGWISLLFGLTPIVTGVLAPIWLTERGLTPSRLLGSLVALAGLAAIFISGLEQGRETLFGLMAVLLSVISHSLSSVWVKRVSREMDGLVIAAGGLGVSLPLFAITWLLTGGTIPAQIDTRAIASIAYLGIVASAFGFALYYYLLKRVEVTQVALIAMITPVLALLLGQLLNGEAVNSRIWLGAVLIIFGVGTFQFGGVIRKSLKTKESRRVD